MFNFIKNLLKKKEKPKKEKIMASDDEEEFTPWHKMRPGLNQALTAARKDPTSQNILYLENTIDEALKGKYIKRRDGMLIETNENNRSYSCMDQADMAIVLFRAGYILNRPKWINLGKEAKETNCVLYDNGGLRLKGLNDTAWFCGQTNRKRKEKGGTLNKHLFAAASFLTVNKDIRDLGDNDQKLIERYRDFALQGLFKMFNGKDLPRLRDFFVLDNKKKPHNKAWIYYGANKIDGTKCYYLKNKEKNGTYHILCMKFIHELAVGLQGHYNWDNFKSIAKDDLKIMYEIYNNKIKDGGLGKNSTTKFGEFNKIQDPTKSLSTEAINWYKQF